jgi:hypothetical protein
LSPIFVPSRRVLAGLVATLLLAGWLALALAVPRPDEVAGFVNEFLNALKAIFRVQDGRAVTSRHVPINVRSEEVIRAFGGEGVYRIPIRGLARRGRQRAGGEGG